MFLHMDVPYTLPALYVPVMEKIMKCLSERKNNYGKLCLISILNKTAHAYCVSDALIGDEDAELFLFS